MASRQRRLQVLIVDDHEIVREGLVTVVGKRHHIVAVAGTGEEALSATRNLQPEVAVVDMRLPDMSGDELCRKLLAAAPEIAVIVLTTYLSEEIVRRAVDAGASAFVTKAAGLQELLDTLDRVACDGRALQPGDASQIVVQLHELVSQRMDGVGLTPQQQSVLELAAEGLTNHEIGARLYISESTVRFHLQKLKTLFGARSKTDLIARTIRAAVIQPGSDDVGP